MSDILNMQQPLRHHAQLLTVESHSAIASNRSDSVRRRTFEINSIRLSDRIPNTRGSMANNGEKLAGG